MDRLCYIGTCLYENKLRRLKELMANEELVIEMTYDWMYQRKRLRLKLKCVMSDKYESKMDSNACRW